MGRKSAFGTVEKSGAAAVEHSKANMRHGPHSKNIGPSRNSKPSNVGTHTAPIKGRDRGTG